MATEQPTEAGGTDGSGTDQTESVSVAAAVDKMGMAAEVVSGFGAVTNRLSMERQAKADRSLDALEAMGEGYRREEQMAHAQFHEVAGEVEGALKLFWQGVSDPDSIFGPAKKG